MTRDELLQCLVAGVAAGAIGWGFTVLLHTGFKSEDVFAFAGALIGAAAAVGGGAWLADRAKNVSLKREADLIRAECEPVFKAASESCDALPTPYGSEWPKDFKPSLGRLYDVSRETPALLREAIARSTALDFRQRVKVIKAEAAIISFGRYYDDCFGPDKLDPMDERHWPSILDHLRQSLFELRSSL